MTFHRLFFLFLLSKRGQYDVFLVAWLKELFEDEERDLGINFCGFLFWRLRFFYFLFAKEKVS